MSKELTTKSLLTSPNVQQKFSEMLGKRANGFLTSVLQIINSNKLLQEADPMSIYNSAMISATLDLPINPNLGFAYIVPFNQKVGSNYVKMAQFQMGWRGYVQLAQRTGLYKTISVTAIYEGQIKSNNPLKGIEFDFEAKTSEKIIGYCSYFELLNGFEKYLYMTAKEMEEHAKKYSQTYKKGFGVWKDNFDAMALKTVLKMNLQKFGPLSVEMQTAVQADQSVIKNVEQADFEYVDNNEIQIVNLPTLELNSENFIVVREGLFNKNHTLEEVEQNYHLTTEVREALTNGL